MIEMHENHKYIESLFFEQVNNMTRRKPSTYDLWGWVNMSMEAKQHYNQELVQLMKEHDLLYPEEEEQIMSYLWVTH